MLLHKLGRISYTINRKPSQSDQFFETCSHEPHVILVARTQLQYYRCTQYFFFRLWSYLLSTFTIRIFVWPLRWSYVRYFCHYNIPLIWMYNAYVFNHGVSSKGDFPFASFENHHIHLSYDMWIRIVNKKLLFDTKKKKKKIKNF
jgi:hypothetical protein